MSCLLLRFDGSFGGGCGGCGAVLLKGNAPVWQGARFLPDCPTSAHAEFEGLILGLEAASDRAPGELTVEGDCRVVLSQAAGEARSRKLSKLNARAQAGIRRLPLKMRPAFANIPREDNAHADALARAAVDASQALHGAAVLLRPHQLEYPRQLVVSFLRRPSLLSCGPGVRHGRRVLRDFL